MGFLRRALWGTPSGLFPCCVLADPSFLPPQSPALTLLLEDESCWLRTLPQALTEAEANVAIHRKGWYLALPSPPSGRWRSSAVPGPALKGKPACSGPSQGTGHHTPGTPVNTHLGLDRHLSWNGVQGLRKPWPLSGLLGYYQDSGGTQAKEARGPAMGANWTRACAFGRTPASLHLLEGEALEGGPRQGGGRTRWGSLPPSPSQFRVQATQMQGLPSSSAQPCLPCMILFPRKV